MQKKKERKKKRTADFITDKAECSVRWFLKVYSYYVSYNLIITIVIIKSRGRIILKFMGMGNVSLRFLVT